MQTRILNKSWGEFLKDPVFGRTYFVGGAPVAFEVYRLPGLPQWFLDLVEEHERGHMAGVHACEHAHCLMFEGGDGYLEKLVFPFVLVHRLLTGSWYCKEHKFLGEKK